MALNALAIDIGKHSFHLFGIDDDGVMVSRTVSRLKLVTTVERLDPKIIAMEACGSAHHWERMFQAAGRNVCRASNCRNRCLDENGVKTDT